MLFLDSFVPQMEGHLHSMKVEVEVVTGRVGFDEVGTYQSCYQPLSQRSADFFWKGTNKNDLNLGRPYGPVTVQLGHCIVKAATDNM